MFTDVVDLLEMKLGKKQKGETDDERSKVQTARAASLTSLTTTAALSSC